MSREVRFAEHLVTSLNTGDRLAWEGLRKRHPALASPLFSIPMLELIEDVRGGVRVAVARDSEGVLAMAPYCRQGAVATPFAGPLSDMQAILCRADSQLSMHSMLRAVGLSALQFNAQLALPDSPCRRGHMLEHSAPYIDLSNGFEAYRAERRRAGSDELKEAMRKGRKLRRERGEATFDPYSSSMEDLQQVLQWKSDQLKANSQFDFFAVPWIRRTLESVVAVNNPDCRGMLCSLRVDGELAAGAIAVRSEDVLHGWVTAYNPHPKFRKYSPGILLLSELLQAAPELGIRRIDMGGGGEAYKRSFASGAFATAEGVIDRRPFYAVAKNSLLNFREWLRETSLRRMLQTWANQRRYPQTPKGAN